jgi:Holliday junction resolvase RusA-like endonuclease
MTRVLSEAAYAEHQTRYGRTAAVLVAPAIAPQTTLLELRKVSLTLPFPPSVNDLYRAPAKTENVSPYLKFLTKEQKQFRQAVAGIVGYALGRRANKQPPLLGRLRVRIDLYPANEVRMDIDNRIKAILDALQRAQVYADDEQLDVLIVDRIRGTQRGECEVSIEEIAQ